MTESKEPRGQRWVKIFDGDLEYCITSNIERTRYIIYRVERLDDGNIIYTELGTGSNPSDLERKYVWQR